MRRLADIEARRVESPDQQISLTDPDARSMATSGRGSGVVGYNVQVAVETEHHLIVAHEVTNVGSDRSQLATMAKEAKAVLRADRLDAVADRGYFNSEEILACEQAGIIESFPLFGLRLEDYDSLFAEKLELLLQIRDSEHVHWSGKHRPSLTGQGVYPRPLQDPLPIWVGVGGTPSSFVRAGALGLPLMVAIIGGEVKRFRPLIDLYRDAGRRAGHPSEQLKVGMHSPGYVAATTKDAADDFFPGWASAVASVARERGWPPVTRADFDAQRGGRGRYSSAAPRRWPRRLPTTARRWAGSRESASR